MRGRIGRAGRLGLWSAADHGLGSIGRQISPLPELLGAVSAVAISGQRWQRAAIFSDLFLRAVPQLFQFTPNIRRAVAMDKEQDDFEREFREAFELDDDEPIDLSAFEIWRRQRRS